MDQLAVAAQEIAAQVTVGTAEGQLEAEVAGTAVVQVVVEEQTDPVAVVDTGVVAAGTAEGQLEAAAGLQALALVARWLG